MKKFSVVLFLLFVFLTSGFAAKKVTVTVKNPLDTLRNEMVEISLKKLSEKLGLKPSERILVKDAYSKILPSQIAVDYGKKDSLLIFPTSVKAKGTATYFIQRETSSKYPAKVFGRLVPERKDDFTWENDRIAFRVYGPALQATGEISSGIDVWAKRTDKLIVNKWYKDELEGRKTYHTDGGEGLDMYKVGPTLGAGATAPFIDGKLWFSKNFTTYEILDNGPLRITVKLNYAPYTAGSSEVSETRIISLDAGSQLNKIQLFYNSNLAMHVATGIVLRDSKEEQTYIDPLNRYFAHAEPADKDNGTIYEAVVGEKPFHKIFMGNGHLLGVQLATPNNPYIYYQGAGWDKWGFESFDSWKKYVNEFTNRIKVPLLVVIK